MLPDKALENHIAILGKAGSGKTVTAKGIAEKLLNEGQRVCAVDPTGVWWGLKSSADGKKAAYPVVVFGGEHADFPIGSNHGAAIAEIVGTTDTPSIIDARLMSVGERTRFFTDFAETLLRKNAGPLHLFIDEAHVFAPQGRVADPQSGKMLHAANNLISLGRASGLRVTMISQRPAKLHKDSLTQVETLIAMRLIAPQDRKAVQDWICEWADPQEGKEILTSLPSLPTGTGWIWAPEQGILKKTKFPMIKTYDSSKAPKGNEKRSVVLSAIDHEGIASKLETVAAEIFSEDPARLKKRIAELEKQKVVVTIDPAQLQAEYDRGFKTGFDTALQDMSGFIDSMTYPDNPRTETTSIIKPVSPKPAPKQRTIESKDLSADPLLNAALSVWPAKMTWGGLASMCGRKARGGHFNTTRKRLIDEGLVREEGSLVIPCMPPESPQGAIPADLLEQNLPQPAAKMFSTIRQNPGIEIGQLADALGMKPRGGHWNTGMALLKRNGFIHDNGGGMYISKDLEESHGTQNTLRRRR